MKQDFKANSGYISIQKTSILGFTNGEADS